MMVVYTQFISRVTPWVPCSHQNSSEHIHSFDFLLRLYTTWCHFVMTSVVIFSLPIIIQTDTYLKLVLILSVNCSSDQLVRRDGGGSTFRLIAGLFQVELDSAALESIRQSKPPWSYSGNWICGKWVLVTVRFRGSHSPEDLTSSFSMSMLPSFPIWAGKEWLHFRIKNKSLTSGV